MEKHVALPGLHTPTAMSMHVISTLLHQPSRLERRGGSGRFIPYLKTPGTITTLPIGFIADFTLSSPAEFIHVGIADDAVASVLTEMDRRPANAPEYLRNVDDPSIQRLVNLLTEELENEGRSGRLYVDSLINALIVRYLLLTNTETRASLPYAHTLPQHLFRRVVETMDASLNVDLSLNILAQETGYSRTHFLRMFRLTTGITPHQFLLDLRLTRAQEMLKNHKASLVEIARMCGFVTQSHMTTVFHQRLGITPARLRRSMDAALFVER